MRLLYSLVLVAAVVGATSQSWVVAPLAVCVAYNTGEVAASCNGTAEARLPAFAGSGTCRALLREAACARLCAVTAGPFVLCSSHCDALHSACRDADADDDAAHWCATALGDNVRVGEAAECWQPREASAARSRVYGPGLAPTAGWSTYGLRIELRDAHGNGVGPHQMHRVAARLGGAALTVTADGSTSYTWFQQQRDALAVTLDGGHHLPGSPFPLSVLPRSRCLSGAPSLAHEPLCPAFAGRLSCCGAHGAASLLAYAERPQHSAQCRAAWRELLCVAACHPRQHSLLAPDGSGTAPALALVVSPEVCRGLREACGLSDAHCTGALVPWGDRAGHTLRLHVSGAAPVWRDPPSPRHSLLHWSLARLEAGATASVRLTLRDAAGIDLDLTDATKAGLRLYCRHLPSGHLLPIEAASLATRQPLTFAGPYELRGFLHGEAVGHSESPQLLWVHAAPPVVPVVAPPGSCPDRFGNEPTRGCTALAGVPACAATLVSGRGLSVLSPESAFTIRACDALQQPVLDSGLVFRVAVNNRSVAVAPRGGLVTYRAAGDVQSASVSVWCNNVPLPGSPWTAVRATPSWREQQRELERRRLQLRQAGPPTPPVTPVSAAFSALGNAVEVTFDAPTSVPPCATVTTTLSAVVSCHWQTPSLLVWVLGYNASALPGAVITVGGGVLPALAPGGVPSAPVTLTLVAPVTPAVPLVSISAPLRARTSLQLDASGSERLGGRPAARWSWAVGGASIPASLAAAVGSARGSVLSLDATTLGNAPLRLSFVATATSWLGKVASSPSVAVLWEPGSSSGPENARVLGPSLIETSAAAAFVLRGIAGNPQPTAAIDYAWYPTTNVPFVSPSINRVLADTKDLQYAPPELHSSAAPYLLRYSVTYAADAAAAGGSPVSITVAPSLYPGDATLRWPRSAPLLLNASGFVDDAANFVWSWNCSRVHFDGVTRPCFQSGFVLSSGPLQFIPAGYLQPGLSTFVVSVGGQSGVFAVEAVLPEVPVVHVEGPLFGLQPAGERLVLRGVAADPFAPCSAFDCEELSYQWTLSDTSVVLERPNGPNLQLPPNALVAGQLYSFQLCVTSAKGVGCASVQVRSNAPPASGLCTATRSPGAASTTVTIACEGWTDAPGQGPLQYWFAGPDGSVISAGFSTSNSEPVVELAPEATYVLVRVADSLGSASPAFVVPIGVAVTTPLLVAPAAATMEQLAKQDQVERALQQCDGVEGYLSLRVALESRGMLPALLGCALRLANSSDTTSTQLSQLLANATFLLNATAGPAVADESVEAAVRLAAVAIARMPKDPLVPLLLAQIGRSLAARTAPGAGPEERFVAFGLTLVGQSSLGVPLVHDNVTLLPTLPLVSLCAAVDSLYILADSWNPANMIPGSVMCGALVELQLLRNQSSFGELATLDAGSCLATSYCASLVAGAWTREGCTRTGNSSCLCNSSAYPVSLFYEIPQLFTGGVPSGPTGFYLGPIGIAALIAVAVVAALGLLLLLFSALRSSTSLAAAAGPVARFAWRAEGAEAAREADLRPPFARQQVSFGGSAPFEARDLEEL